MSYVYIIEIYLKQQYVSKKDKTRNKNIKKPIFHFYISIYNIYSI